MSVASPLSTPEAWVACPKCHTQLPSYDPTRSRYFGCYHCRTFFGANALQTSRLPERLDGFKQPIIPGPALPLGAAGELGGYRCRLTGYQVRGEKNDRTAEWREYQLRPAAPTWTGDDPADFPLQLAEYQGHWLLIRRATTHPMLKGNQPFNDHSWTPEGTAQEFQLWHRYQPLIRDALGEFDWNILEDEYLQIQEFIAPPYQLVSEKRKGGPTAWYLAEYLTPSQVAIAFGMLLSELPAQQGIGAAQPAPVPGWPQLRRLAVAGALALLAAQLLLLFFRPPQPVLSQDFTVAEAVAPAASIPAAPAGATPAEAAAPTPTPAGGTSQMLVSKSFALASPTALAVTVQVPHLDNHWAEVTASLVNEQTGRGYEFTRSVEYYHGVEDGESWTEGGHDTEATLHHVPAGRYHFNLYPSLDAGAGTGTLTLQVEENTPLWSNFWLALLALGLVPGLLGWRHYSFESSRWQNSDFNPYPTASD